MTDPLILANARVVLPNEVVTGSVAIADGVIAGIGTGRRVPPGAVDCDGDLLVPGLIELHTDNLERHIEPRPDVAWPRGAAILAHDAELAACGITTVFDAMRVGSSTDGRDYAAYARGLATELARLRAAGVLRITHHVHLRAEICSETLLDEFAEFGPDDGVRLVSLMDHTPGQRQFRDIDKLRAYFLGRRGGGEADFRAHVEKLVAQQARFGAVHEAGAVAQARRLGAVLASHDDTTAEQVARSAAHGARLAEFPTTPEAARACRDHGIAVMMGAPNMMRGASHSGNVSAGVLAGDDLLDILSSDYVPSSLLTAALMVGALWGDLARGIATVTAAPATAAGLADRGRIVEGHRADLVRARDLDDLVLTRGTWVAGRRVS